MKAAFIHGLPAVIMITACSPCPPADQQITDTEAFAGVSAQQLTELFAGRSLSAPVTWWDGLEGTLTATLEVRPGTAYPSRSGAERCEPRQLDALAVSTRVVLSTDDGRLLEEMDEWASLTASGGNPVTWSADALRENHDRLNGALSEEVLEGPRICFGEGLIEVEFTGSDDALADVLIYKAVSDESSSCREPIAGTDVRW